MRVRFRGLFCTVGFAKFGTVCRFWLCTWGLVAPVIESDGKF